MTRTACRGELFAENLRAGAAHGLCREAPNVARLRAQGQTGRAIAKELAKLECGYNILP
jgi:hypothetical protein